MAVLLSGCSFMFPLDPWLQTWAGHSDSAAFHRANVGYKQCIRAQPAVVGPDGGFRLCGICGTSMVFTLSAGRLHGLELVGFFRRGLIGDGQADDEGCSAADLRV